MKIPDELVQEYIDLVKEKYNLSIDRNSAYKEYLDLIMVVGLLYLPREVMSWFEIQVEK